MRRPLTVGFWNYHRELSKNNFMLTNRNVAIGDDLLLPLFELNRYLEARGVRCATLDLLDGAGADAYVFVDMPRSNDERFLSAIRSGKPLYLLTLESPLIRPENFDVERHSCFTKVFTYEDSLVDGMKYVKINYSFAFPEVIPCDPGKKEKLCVMICGNKKVPSSRRYRELYSERKRAIDWFEANHPEDFDLYGFGWNKPKFRPKNLLNPVKMLRNMLSAELTTYRGAVTRKSDVLPRYRFSICYENAENVPGYITEKIFDCFFAGCVPIYLGADNITRYIPPGCFIDRREFKDYGSLYRFLRSMSDNEYRDCVDEIQGFLQSDAAKAFSCDTFVRVVAEELLSGDDK